MWYKKMYGNGKVFSIYKVEVEDILIDIFKMIDKRSR